MVTECTAVMTVTAGGKALLSLEGWRLPTKQTAFLPLPCWLLRGPIGIVELEECEDQQRSPLVPLRANGAVLKARALGLRIHQWRDEDP